MYEDTNSKGNFMKCRCNVCFSQALNHNNLLMSKHVNTFCFLSDKITGHTPSRSVFIVLFFFILYFKSRFTVMGSVENCTKIVSF